MISDARRTEESLRLDAEKANEADTVLHMHEDKVKESIEPFKDDVASCHMCTFADGIVSTAAVAAKRTPRRRKRSRTTPCRCCGSGICAGSTNKRARAPSRTRPVRGAAERNYRLVLSR